MPTNKLPTFRQLKTTIWLLLFPATLQPVAGAEPASHSLMRPLPTASKRARPKGPTFFVDAAKGKDSNSGSKNTPWQSIGHALAKLNAGDTLCLRGGTYYEHIYCALVGTEKKPITIRSYPGELAVIDGSFREFFDDPQKAWEPFPKGSAGEYQSKRTYKNLRNIHGRFGDSMIGLQVYYYIDDLRGERYAGPGIWLDRLTGRIHIRLQPYKAEGTIRARTEFTMKYLPSPLHKLQSYQGETDPRKLPLIIAPFHSTPLVIDRARHLRLQDLVVRGGGHDVVDIRYGEHIEFDNVTIYAGAYGLRAINTGPFKFHNSAIRGSVPPWSTRGESSLRERPWVKDKKDLTRLNTHALLLPASGEEYSVYYFPFNHDWEISNSEFTDAHDGVYLGDIVGLKFHHNYVHNFQDDGIYLSSFRRLHHPKYGPRQIYQNVISGCIMTFAFGGDARLSSEVHVYRNILDGASVVSDHGSPPWESMRWYHNTIIANPRFLLRASHIKPGQTWQVFNNILLVGKATTGKPQEGAKWQGNFAGDPKFARPGNFQLQRGSTAINAGKAIPTNWPDPLSKEDEGAPDAGAIPFGAGPLRVGQFGRLRF